MPYAGPQDGGASMFQAFLAGQSNKRENKLAKHMEEIRAAQIEIQKGYLSLAEDQTARKNAESEQRMYMDRQQESRDAMTAKMKGLDFERGLQDDTRQKKINSEVDQADTDVAYGIVHKLVRKYPELEPYAQIQSAAMQKMSTPQAKAIHARESEKAMIAMASKIDLDRADAHWNDALNQGGLSGIGGQPDEGLVELRNQVKAGTELYRASGGKDGLSGAKATDILNKAVAEKAKNDAIFEARNTNADEMVQIYMPKASGEQREQLLAVINAYRRPHPGGPDWKATNTAINAIMNPKPDMTPYQQESLELRRRQVEQAGIRIEQADKHIQLNSNYPGSAVEKADQAPKTKPINSSQLDFARRYLVDHKKATPAEVEAAWKAQVK